MLFEISICILLMIITRLLVPLINPPFSGGDAIFHYLFAKTIKDNNNKIPKLGKSNYLLQTYFRYPILYHYFLSFVPTKFWILVSKISGLFFDTIYAIIIFLVSKYIFHHINPFTSVILFLTIPQLVFLDNRAHSLSPRPLGEVLLTITLISIFLYYNTAEIYWIAVAILAGAFIFISSKGASQGYLLFSLIISVFMGSLLPMLVFILSFLLIIIFSRGLYLNMLKSHLLQLQYSLTHYNRFNINYKGFLPRFRISRKFKTFKELVKYNLKVYNGNTLLLVTLNNPAFLFLLFLIPLENDFLSLNYWFYAGVISFILVHFWPFQIIGGPDRYIEYIALPIVIIAVNSYSIETLNFIIAIGLLVILFNFITLVKNPRRNWERHKNKEQLLRFLSDLPKSRILALPHRWGVEIGYRTDHILLGWSGMQWDDIEFSKERMTYFCPNDLKTIRYDLNELINKYSLDIVVMPNGLLAQYQTSGLNTIYSNKFYSVLSIHS